MVSRTIEAQFTQEGIALCLGAGIKSFAQNGDTTEVAVEVAGQAQTLYCDKVLVAVGRKANTTGFGLEGLGLELNGNGTIKVDEYMRTSYPNILACGDVAGPYQFTHTAAHQAWYASVNALFGRFKKFKADYRVIPWVIFTDPEVAHVGASASDLQAQGVAYDEVKYGIDDLRNHLIHPWH